jgi:hypothetical protein
MGDLGGFSERLENDREYKKSSRALTICGNSIVLINPDIYGQEIRLSSLNSVC